MWIASCDNLETSVIEYVFDSRPDEIVVIHKQNLDARKFGLPTTHCRCTSALTHTDGTGSLSSLAKMDAAEAFQMKGVGAALCSAR